MPCSWNQTQSISEELRYKEGGSNTWQYIIFPQCSESQKRCCFMCGVFCKKRHCNVLFEDIEEMLLSQDSEDILENTYRNLLDSSEHLHTQMNSKFYTIGLCYFCYSWLQRKKKSRRSGYLFPLQILRRHINTLTKYKKRFFDSRILWYLCQSLCSKNETVGVNLFYLTLLEHERRIVYDIYKSGKRSIKQILAKHYVINNRGVVFASSISIAQFLREHLSDKSDEKDKNQIL